MNTQMQKFNFQERKDSKEELVTALQQAGCKPHRNNTFQCVWHNDSSPSAGIKKGPKGWFYHCFVCGISMDVWDIESKTKGVSLSELVKERTGSTQTTAKWQYLYDTVDDLIAAIDAVDVQEINRYTNPETNNLDLITIRYIPRGENKKAFLQAHQTNKGIVPKRPAGLLPLFNRLRLKDADTVIFVEGEGCVRRLTELGFIATTGAGGSNNAAGQDYSPLSGKTVILWADNDHPGQKYMEQVREKLLELENPATVLSIDVKGLELPEGGDVKDLCEKVLSEGGTEEDCKDYVRSLVDDASEVNTLQCLEDHLQDMREGNYSNLPISDFPILTNEANFLLNKRIGIVYGAPGLGKSLFVGKFCDDLILSGHTVARLQLEDEMEQHLLRSLAQQSLRADLASPAFHRANPDESKVLYEQFRPTLEKIASSVVAGEDDDWDADKILNWVESQLKQGKELVVVDPVSVVMDKNIWIVSHRLMWGMKKILAKYPHGRVVLVSHPNSEGDISGGQAYKRFSHGMLMLNRLKAPKEMEIIDTNGELSVKNVYATIAIVKSRYGPGQGSEIAVEIDPSSLKLRELGVIVRELKATKPTGRSFDTETDIEL